MLDMFRISSSPSASAALTGERFAADAVEILLCGNPEMIRDVVKRLEATGYRLHYDRYW
jgi:NAD(P)H-flavin reductase